MQHGTAGGVPDYATGEAHTLLAPVLAARPPADAHHREVRVPHRSHRRRRVNDGALCEDAGRSRAQPHAGLRAPADRPTRAQFGRKRLDLVLLHNPERFQRGDRPGLHRAIRDACAVLEEETAAGHVAGYGIATWVGLEEEAFTGEEVLAWPVKPSADSRTTTWPPSGCPSTWSW
ncbi:hypothetical protein ACIQVK_39505 [Streptomyces sp. NPDC090493]|uniref:hypothetical protein n=1 Tax=Streptomyces sp. NPDC090493 TaxID=3365964 RepID=UPI00382EF152